MKLSGRPHRIIVTWVILATILSTGTAHAQSKSYRVLYDFGQGKSDGWNPSGSPAVAKNGDLYGITVGGGDYTSGTAFKLTAPKTRGGKWKWSSLYEFPGGNGGGGPTSLLFGEDGNLYGAGGRNLFELSAPKSGDGAWKYHQLYALNGTTEGESIQGIVLDAEGNFYGATEEGGDMNCLNGHGCGTVFELKRPTKTGGKWRLSVLYSFTGEPDGELPFAGPTLDQKGNVYGTTNSGGTFGHGVAYRLTPPAKRGHPWTETVIYSFDLISNIGSNPESLVIVDRASNLYGSTAFGGDLNCQAGSGCGVVYELSRPAKKGATWSYATLYAFEGGRMVSIPQVRTYSTAPETCTARRNRAAEKRLA